MFRKIALVAPTILLFAACSSGGSKTSPVNVALKVSGPGAAFAADACGNVLSSAKLVLRKISLEGEDDAPGSQGDEIEAGPALIDLTAADFNGTIQQSLFTAQVPAGTYTKAKFDIHKLDSGDAEDVAAATADPGLAEMQAAGISVRIAGVTTGGVAFQFDSSLNETQEQPVNVVVGDATTTTGIDGVTLAINPNRWFVDATSGACLDPNNAAVKSQIEDNVKSSIKVDEDDDHDGVEDSIDSDGGDGSDNAATTP